MAADKISAAIQAMNEENIHPDDARLHALLHSVRPSPSVPPRFQENVWRRIEKAEAFVKSQSWLDVLVALILRPRFALATATALVVAGALFGVYEGNIAANQTAQAQYLAAVAPPSIR